MALRLFAKSFIFLRFFLKWGVNNIESNSTYLKANFFKDDDIKNNENYCQKFGLKLTDKDRSLPLMYCPPKLHKTPIGIRFIIASKNCNTNHILFNLQKILGCEEFFSNY